MALTRTGEPLAMAVGGTGVRQAGARGYQDGGRDYCRLLPGRVLFRSIVPPLQLGMVEPYPVQSKWFHSHLPLEGIGSYLAFLGHNQ
jgi:hypothetical protein